MITPQFETDRYVGEVCRVKSQSIVECRLPGSEINSILAVHAHAVPTECSCSDGEVLYGGKVIFGFAGSVADAFTLSERFEEMLNKYSGNLMRSAVELAELWRSDKARKLEAMMITADKDTLLIVSGTGEVIEPEDGVCAIGSGGNYALAAARALFQETDYTAEEIARKSLKIASEICVFTNGNVTCETL